MQKREYHGFTMKSQRLKQQMLHTIHDQRLYRGGYMGIQHRSPKWVIFSIWDNPSGSSDDKVEVLAQGKG